MSGSWKFLETTIAMALCGSCCCPDCPRFPDPNLERKPHDTGANKIGTATPVTGHRECGILGDGLSLRAGPHSLGPRVHQRGRNDRNRRRSPGGPSNLRRARRRRAGARDTPNPVGLPQELGPRRDGPYPGRGGHRGCGDTEPAMDRRVLHRVGRLDHRAVADTTIPPHRHQRGRFTAGGQRAG